MSWLKTLPIAYRGLVDEIRILNFSVPMHEVKELVSSRLKLLNFDGRAMISMADLQIQQMRPRHFPKWPSLNYRHVAFRLLVEHPDENEGGSPAIYFLKSFCTNPCIICGGAFFTDYRMCKASIEGDEQVRIESEGTFLEYALRPDASPSNGNDIRHTARLNTAYAEHRNQLWQTQIKPVYWPLESVHCTEFTTNMFKEARLEAAYTVKGSLRFERSAPKLLSRVQRREHVQPVRVRCSPL